jgi:hypothetical protein
MSAAIAAAQRAVGGLATVVGDPETVPDERGWIPDERREMTLTLFASRRATKVRELRADIRRLPGGAEDAAGAVPAGQAP